MTESVYICLTVFIFSDVLKLIKHDVKKAKQKKVDEQQLMSESTTKHRSHNYNRNLPQNVVDSNLGPVTSTPIDLPKDIPITSHRPVR